MRSFLILGLVLAYTSLTTLAAEPVPFVFGQKSDGSALKALCHPEVLAPDRDPNLQHILVLGDHPLPPNRPPEVFVTRIETLTKGIEFPPQDEAYQGENAEAHHIWRFVGLLAPHAIVGNPEIVSEFAEHPASGLGTIPEFTTWANLEPSPATIERNRRANRTPEEIAAQLSQHYGYKLNSIAYIPALALIARHRLAKIRNDETTVAEIKALVEAAPPPSRLTGATVAGHLIFTAVGMPERAVEGAQTAFDESGRPLPFVPNHSEMSDSVFMNCPLLAAVGRATGEDRYFEACLNHLRHMKSLCLRSDGIYRHSPLDEAAWGRGNGFPALGLALTLSELSPDSVQRPEILASFQDHLTALIQFQDESGMWHQVIDDHRSYREFTSTCMITFAIFRGLHRGWLDQETFEPIAQRGWNAIKLRISTNGRDLVDVCTGTGKQKSLQAYFERKAILGRDDRGGAMALMISTEIASEP